jgi:HAD superfamily hydrolase (TIGR01662 family)
MIIGFDYDGTLVESWTATPLPGVETRLSELPAGARTFIATNQAGPVFRAVLGQKKYPTVEDVVTRLADGLKALDWQPDFIIICVSSGKTEGEWFVAETNVRTEMYDALEARNIVAMIERAASYRKPAPKMLYEAARIFNVPRTDLLYIGDMNTDAQAAAAAGCRYIDAAQWREKGII